MSGSPVTLDKVALSDSDASHLLQGIFKVGAGRVLIQFLSLSDTDG